MFHTLVNSIGERVNKQLYLFKKGVVNSFTTLQGTKLLQKATRMTLSFKNNKG